MKSYGDTSTHRSTLPPRNPGVVLLLSSSSPGHPVRLSISLRKKTWTRLSIISMVDRFAHGMPDALGWFVEYDGGMMTCVPGSGLSVAPECTGSGSSSSLSKYNCRWNLKFHSRFLPRLTDEDALWKARGIARTRVLRATLAPIRAF